MKKGRERGKERERKRSVFYQLPQFYFSVLETIADKGRDLVDSKVPGGAFICPSLWTPVPAWPRERRWVSGAGAKLFFAS